MFCFAAEALIALLLSVGVIKNKYFGSISTKYMGDLEEHVLYSEPCLASKGSVSFSRDSGLLAAVLRGFVKLGYFLKNS